MSVADLSRNEHTNTLHTNFRIYIITMNCGVTVMCYYMIWYIYVIENYLINEIDKFILNGTKIIFIEVRRGAILNLLCFCFCVAWGEYNFAAEWHTLLRILENSHSVIVTKVLNVFLIFLLHKRDKCECWINPLSKFCEIPLKLSFYCL